MSTLKPIFQESDLWIDPDSKAMHLRVIINDKRRSKSSKIKFEKNEVDLLINGPKSDVIRLLKKHRKALRLIHKELMSGKSRKRGRLLFEELWAEWVDLKSPTWKPMTIVDIEYIGRKYLLPWFGHEFPEDINEIEWEKFIVKNRQFKLRKHKTYLTMFYNYLLKRELILKVPEFRNPDGETKAGKVYSTSEWKSLIENAVHPDTQLQILMGLKMGMRKGEILGLHKSRIDFNEMIVRLEVTDTKTKKARVIPIVPEVYDRLMVKIMDSDGDYLFPSPKDPAKPISTNKTAWQATKKRAGVVGRFHDLRHTCATEMAHSNIAPSIACRILGMSLAIYDKVYCNPSESEMKKALTKINWGPK